MSVAQQWRELMMGQPARMEQVTPLTEQQQQMQQERQQAVRQQGAPGAFGEAADYWRGMMRPDSPQMDALAAPEMRRFRQQVAPGLMEQLGGHGIGAHRGSAAAQLLGRGAADLGERLGAIRAQYGAQGAQQLASMGQQAMQPYYQQILWPRTPGMLENIAPGVGKGLGAGLADWMRGDNEETGRSSSGWLPAIGSAAGGIIGGPGGAAVGGGLAGLGQKFIDWMGRNKQGGGSTGGLASVGGGAIGGGGGPGGTVGAVGGLPGVELPRVGGGF